MFKDNLKNRKSERRTNMKMLKKNLALILCLTLVGMLSGCGSQAKSGPSEAIKEYFDACNAMDMEAIDNASIPDGKEGYYTSQLLSTDDYSFYENWRSTMGFYRSKLDAADFIKFNPEFVIFDDYSYVSTGPNGELLNYDREEITLEEALPDFSVNYKIEEIEQFDDCTAYLKSGLSLIEIEDMDKVVALSDGSFLDVQDMYVAKLKVEWSYGNNLYGYNKSWWNDEEFCNFVPASYEDTIKEHADLDYIVFVYKYNDEWYVCPENLKASTFLYAAEF